MSEDKFTSLTGLTKLNLSHNNIFILDGGAFKVMLLLNKLNLNYNPIIRLRRGFGDYLTNLRELSLRGCQLADLTDPTPFVSMTSLQVLDMRDNLIQVSIFSPNRIEIEKSYSVYVCSNGHQKVPPYICSCSQFKPIKIKFSFLLCLVLYILLHMP